MIYYSTLSVISGRKLDKFSIYEVKNDIYNIFRLILTIYHKPIYTVLLYIVIDF